MDDIKQAHLTPEKTQAGHSVIDMQGGDGQDSGKANILDSDNSQEPGQGHPMEPSTVLNVPNVPKTTKVDVKTHLMGIPSYQSTYSGEISFVHEYIID